MSIKTGDQILAADVYPLLSIANPGGRLTLESGVAVSVSDQDSKSTLYYTPYIGNTIALYDGSSVWEIFNFSELSLDVSGLTQGKMHDIFIYDNSGTLTLEALEWTNDTTRATALTLQDGILVKSGATTRRYLGSVKTGVGSVLYDSKILRMVWNMYNRVPRSIYLENNSNHTYNGSLRLWDNTASNNSVSLVIGVTGLILYITLSAAIKAGADGSYAKAYLYDSGGSIVYIDLLSYNGQYVTAMNGAAIDLSEGPNTLRVYEESNHASSSFSRYRMTGEVLG